MITRNKIYFGLLFCLTCGLCLGCGSDSHDGENTETPTDAGDTGTEADDGCFDGAKTVKTASDLAELDGYECINGSLTLSTFSGIDKFELPELKEIRGTLTLRRNRLADLSGLGNLERIEGNIHIESSDVQSLDAISSVEFSGALVLIENPNIEVLDGFDNVTVMQGINLEHNVGLKTVKGFANLEVIYGDFSVIASTGLDSIEGFGMLTGLEGTLHIRDSDISSLKAFSAMTYALGVTLSDNENLSDLSGLTQLEVIQGSLVLDDLPALLSLDGFTSLTKITGLLQLTKTTLSDLSGLANLATFYNVSLKSNSGLASLNGLTVGARLEGTLELTGNPLLADISQLSPLTYVAHLILTDNETLSDITGLANLQNVGERLEVNDMAAMTSLAPLSNLETVGVELKLRGCDGLNDLVGLGGLTAVKRLVLRDNDNLQDMSALSAVGQIEEIEVRGNDALLDFAGFDAWDFSTTQGKGHIEIGSNPMIRSLSGLVGVSVIDASLELGGCHDLVDLSDLTSLTELSGTLTLWKNDNSATKEDTEPLKGLTSLTGLENVNSLGGLFMYENDLIDSLAPLSSLQTIGGLQFSTNRALPYCEICTLIGNLNNPTDNYWIDTEPHHNLTDSCYQNSAFTCSI